MKFKYLIMCGILSLFFCACGSTVEPVRIEVETTESSGMLQAEECSSYDNGEVEVLSQPVENTRAVNIQLKDIVLPESFKDKLPALDYDVRILNMEEEETTSTEEDGDNVEETASEEEETETEETETETEVETEPPEQYVWDSVVFKGLGVHAPSLDEWYRYEHSDISLRDGNYVFTEIGTDNQEKVLQIEMSGSQLLMSQDNRDRQEELVVLTKICTVAYMNDTSGEIVFSDDNVYYRILYMNIDKPEIMELVAHIISYL